MKNARKWMLGISAIALSVAISGCGSTNNITPSQQPNNSSTTAPANQTASPAPSNTSVATNSPKQQWKSAPPMTINKSQKYFALFHTNLGDFSMQLFADSSPKTVNNFVFLAKHHFYDGDKFFRILKTFMVQTGDPLNNGTGGPGYQFADELPPKYPYAAGIVAMANAGPNTNGSQFFICTVDDSQALQPLYTEFGKIISGMNVVQRIAAIPVVTNPSGEASDPTKNAVIESVTIKTGSAQ